MGIALRVFARDLHPEAAEAFVAVRAVWVQGQRPSEAPNDAYTLTVSWGPPRTGWEIEPNDWEAAAVRFSAALTRASNSWRIWASA